MILKLKRSNIQYYLTNRIKIKVNYFKHCLKSMQTSWTCIHSFNFKLILLKLQRTTVQTIKCCYLRFEKNCFNDGGGNTSPLKVLLLFSTLYYSIFAGFGLTRVSTDGAHFLFYPLYTINYTSSQFAPAYLFTSASATSGVRRRPRTRQE